MPDQEPRAVEELVTAAFALNQRVLARAALLGLLAVVAVEPTGAARAAASAAGWDGTSPTAWLIFEDAVRERLCATAGLAVSAWLAAESANVRVVALLGEQVHVLDFMPRHGFRVVETASVVSA